MSPPLKDIFVLNTLSFPSQNLNGQRKLKYNINCSTNIIGKYSRSCKIEHILQDLEYLQKHIGASTHLTSVSVRSNAVSGGQLRMQSKDRTAPV